MTIRTLIVDDEPPARAWVRAELDRHPDLEVIGECEDGVSAVETILREQPDLVFLDIQMPGLDGFGVIEVVGPELMPPVVFVTAFDQYALKAFDAHAVDYVLKPAGGDRISAAIERVRPRLGEAPAIAELRRILAKLIEEVRSRPSRREWLLVRSPENEVCRFVRFEDIEWIAADRNYVNVHTGKHVYSVRETMRNLELTLDPELFLRIHKSVFVNIAAVREVRPWFNGEYRLTLRGGTEHTVSATFRHRLHEFRKLAPS
ncbi:MAG: LytTR family DNA-binding domain-containing protein [Thermoanaerobaculia bacterium]